MTMQAKSSSSDGDSVDYYQDEYLRDLSGPARVKVEQMLKMANLHIKRTCSVSNMYLRALYELKMEEYSAKYGRQVQEQVMFYTTSAKHAYKIARENFNWREASRGDLGTGVSFCNDPCYSNIVRNRTANDMAMIVVKVLTARVARGFSFMDFPPAACDATSDQTGSVLVKFHDHEFLPTHVVFFDNQSSAAKPGHPRDGLVSRRFRLKSASDSVGL